MREHADMATGAPGNREQRRATERAMRSTDDLRITDDVEIVLTPPQHWHVDVVLYEHERNGELVNASHFHGLTTNDPILAVSLAMKVSKAMQPSLRREKYRVEQVIQCAEVSHLIAVPDVNRMHLDHPEELRETIE